MLVGKKDMVQVTKCELLRAVKASVFAAGTRLMGIAPKAKIEIPITIYGRAYTATIYTVVIQDDNDVQWVGLKVTSYNTREDAVYIKVVLSNDKDQTMTVVQNMAHAVGDAADSAYHAHLLSTLANLTSH